MVDVILEKADQRGRKKGKEEQCHRQREQQDAALQEGHKFISEQLTQLLFKFGRLFLFVVQSGFFGSLHQTFVAIGQRFDKIEYTSDKWCLFIPFVGVGSVPSLGGDALVGHTDRKSGQLRTAHHHPFDDRLPSDGGLDGFGIGLFRHE